MEIRTVIEIGGLLLGVCGALLTTIWRMVNGRLKAIDMRIDAVEKRIEIKMDTVSEKLVHVETNYIDRFTQMYQQLHETEANIMTKMETRFMAMDDKIDGIRDMIHTFATEVVRKNECKAIMDAAEKL